MTNVIFKSTSTFMNKITKVTRRNLENLGQTKFAFNANPDRGFIHIFTLERGCITPEKLGHKEKTIQFLFTNKQKMVLFTLENGAIVNSKNFFGKPVYHYVMNKKIHEHET